MLLFIPAMFVAYWLASADRLSETPMLALFALLVFALWFALAFVRRHARPWGLLLALALCLSAFRLLLGSLATYANRHALNVLADPLFLVTSGVVFPLLAAWLWSRIGIAVKQPLATR